jgi:hypothetical protein
LRVRNAPALLAKSAGTMPALCPVITFLGVRVCVCVCVGVPPKAPTSSATKAPTTGAAPEPGAAIKDSAVFALLARGGSITNTHAQSHAHTHEHTHMHMYTHTHAHARAHAHAHTLALSRPLSHYLTPCAHCLTWRCCPHPTLPPPPPFQSQSRHRPCCRHYFRAGHLAGCRQGAKSCTDDTKDSRRRQRRVLGTLASGQVCGGRGLGFRPAISFVPAGPLPPEAACFIFLSPAPPTTTTPAVGHGWWVRERRGS